METQNKFCHLLTSSEFRYKYLEKLVLNYIKNII